MKITRWNAEINPNQEIIEKLFLNEGLDYKSFNINPGMKLSNQKTILNEIIQMYEGELIFNLSGNQFALRMGDKLEIPSNTTYSISNLKESEAKFISAYKI